MYFVRLSQRSNLQTRILTFIVHIVFRTTPSELFKSRHILYFYFELHFFSCSGPSRANRRVLDEAAFRNTLSAQKRFFLKKIS